MCGRFALTTTNEELSDRFALKTQQNFPNRASFVFYRRLDRLALTKR